MGSKPYDPFQGRKRTWRSRLMVPGAIAAILLVVAAGTTLTVIGVMRLLDSPSAAETGAGAAPTTRAGATSDQQPIVPLPTVAPTAEPSPLPTVMPTVMPTAVPTAIATPPPTPTPPAVVAEDISESDSRRVRAAKGKRRAHINGLRLCRDRPALWRGRLRLCDRRGGPHLDELSRHKGRQRAAPYA